MVRWRIALHQQNALHLVAIKVLEIAAHANFDVHAGYGDKIVVEQTAVSATDGS